MVAICVEVTGYDVDDGMNLHRLRWDDKPLDNRCNRQSAAKAAAGEVSLSIY